MLQAIREHTAGWIAGFIIVLLAIPFALWGVNNYFTTQVETWVAKVNGVEIDQAEYQERMANYRQRLAAMMGEQFDPTIFEQPEYKKQFVESLVKERVLIQATGEAGYAIPAQRVAQEIAGYQTFQVNGQFDGETYRRVLQRVGMSPREFEQRIRETLKSQAVPDALRASQVVTDAELDKVIRMQNQTRTFDYFTLRPESFREQVSATDEEIQAYYDEHSEEFMTPEKVRIRYLELDASELADTIEVDEGTLRGWFEENRHSYLTAEQRLTSHILIEVPSDASPAAVEAARKAAQEARERIVEGGDKFAEVAREVSDDAGSAQAGGDLGWIERGQMSGDFEEALFALEKGEVSKPVKTGYGFHVIKLRDIQEPQGQTFEEAREQVAADYRESEAERLYLEQADRLVDLTYENPGSLDPAADALGLEIQTAGPFTRQGGEGIAADQAVVDAAFSDLVLKDRVNSDPVELGPNHIAVVRVTEHMESKLKPLNEVRGEIRETLLAQKTEAAAEERAEALVERLESGEEDLASVAASVERQPVSADSVQRGAPGHPGALLDQVFSLPAPESPPSYHALAAGQGATAVVAFRDVTPGDPAALSDSQRQRLRQQLAQQYVRAEAEALIGSLQTKAEVKIAEDRL